MNRVRVCLFLAFFASLLPIAAADDAIDFSRDIQPILQAHCVGCHGEDERNGGLSFASQAPAFAESDSGDPAIVVGDPASSELIVRVATADADRRMPPEGERLSDGEIDRLARWIAAGAPWPATSDADATAPSVVEHWSFQPIGDPPVPSVEEADWPAGPLDRFIGARREAAGFAAAGDADPLVLIRRLFYTLTGLPPTPREIDRYLTAVEERGSEIAYRELVDRLLATPAYGERWGRHWMDWVRYADTAGDNSDFPIPQAYLYRNYIIDSLNDDLSYDRFVTEQIAGDLLPAADREERNRQTIATGYLAMSRRFGSLVERYPWHLTIEDTIDNLGRTMLGLTLSCARCHDHKFDPISTRDYYGIYGILDSTQYPFPGIELFQTQHDMVPLIPEEEVAKIMAPYQEETQRLEQVLEERLRQCEKQALTVSEAESTASIDELRQMQAELDATLLKARKAGEALADHLKQTPMYPVAYAVQEGTPRDARIQIKGVPFRRGAEVPRKFPDVLGGQVLAEERAESVSGRLELARWITSPRNPLTARVIVNRVWQRHFGQGLVASTSDFGTRGESPTHPELLDWLATEFMRSGWSLKQLHRTILTSRTFRLAAVGSEANVRRDPENHFYWRFNRQRLDAESIRDTLLLVSGSLDRTPQTEPYPVPPPAEWKYTQHHPFKDEYPSNKRSVYQMTKRLTAQPYLQTFDGPDPNVCTSDRDASVTPLQALYFVNDDFVHARADEIAAKVVAESDDETQRLTRLFLVLFARQPASDELVLLRQHLATVEVELADEPNTEMQAWASLVRSLLRLNEFLYID